MHQKYCKVQKCPGQSATGCRESAAGHGGITGGRTRSTAKCKGVQDSQSKGVQDSGQQESKILSDIEQKIEQKFEEIQQRFEEIQQSIQRGIDGTELKFKNIEWQFKCFEQRCVAIQQCTPEGCEGLNILMIILKVNIQLLYSFSAFFKYTCTVEN